jgi:hypothetical protein
VNNAQENVMKVKVKVKNERLAGAQCLWFYAWELEWGSSVRAHRHRMNNVIGYCSHAGSLSLAAEASFERPQAFNNSNAHSSAVSRTWKMRAMSG